VKVSHPNTHVRDIDSPCSKCPEDEPISIGRGCQNYPYARMPWELKLITVHRFMLI